MFAHHSCTQTAASRRQSGFTITELLVALALGVFLLGGVFTLFTSNQANFRTNESLARLQESARFSVELLSRELRDAGATPCGIRAINSVLREGGSANTSVPWWGDWNAGTVRGFDGTTTLAGLNSVPFGTATTGTRVINTDAIMTLRAAMEEDALHTVQSHNTVSATITLDRAPTQYKDGQVAVLCDSKSGVIFHLTDDPSSTIVNYDNMSRRNCSTQMGWTPSVNCDTSATHKQFEPGSFFVKYDPGFWYIGNASTDGRTSLYRATLRAQTVSGSKVPNIERREMVPDVSDMKIEYLTRTKPVGGTGTAVLSTAWIKADNAIFNTSSGGWSPANSNEALAARITLTFTSREKTGISADGATDEKITRQSVFLVSFRNREIVAN